MKVEQLKASSSGQTQTNTSHLRNMCSDGCRECYESDGWIGARLKHHSPRTYVKKGGSQPTDPRGVQASGKLATVPLIPPACIKDPSRPMDG